jgi:hypothetical protein
MRRCNRLWDPHGVPSRQEAIRMIIKRVLQWQAEKPRGMDVAWILEKNLWQRFDGRANETTKTVTRS